jgi:lipopolysaccharide export LptBFGC system permease protein LptF
MHLHLPNPERLSASTRTARDAFWVAVVSFTAMLAFFMVVGSVSPSTAVAAFIVMGCLVALYAWHMWHTGRRASARDPREIAARERRGF